MSKRLTVDRTSKVKPIEHPPRKQRASKQCRTIETFGDPGDMARSISRIEERLDSIERLLIMRSREQLEECSEEDLVTVVKGKLNV